MLQNKEQEPVLWPGSNFFFLLLKKPLIPSSGLCVHFLVSGGGRACARHV